MDAQHSCRPENEVIKGGLVCRLIYVEKRLYIHDAGGKKVDISHRMTTLLTTTNCHSVGSRRPVDNSIASPDPQQKASTTSHRRTSERANERANIRPLLTPRAIARGACGHSPFYCRNTAVILPGSLDYKPPRFSLSSFDP
jgi:hypothetical protein